MLIIYARAAVCKSSRWSFSPQIMDPIHIPFGKCAKNLQESFFFPSLKKKKIFREQKKNRFANFFTLFFPVYHKQEVYCRKGKDKEHWKPWIKKSKVELQPAHWDCLWLNLCTAIMNLSWRDALHLNRQLRATMK